MTENPIVFKTKTSKTATQENGLEIIISAQFPIRQTESTDRFSFETLILITTLLSLKQFSKNSNFPGNLQMKSSSSILTKLWRLSSEESLERLVSAIAEVNESLSMRNAWTQEHSVDSCAPSQFLQKLKVHLIYLQKFLKKRCHVLPVFGFCSASFDITLIQSFLVPIWTANRIQIPWLSKRLSTASLSLLVE